MIWLGVLDGPLRHLGFAGIGRNLVCIDVVLFLWLLIHFLTKGASTKSAHHGEGGYFAQNRLRVHDR